MKFLKKDCLVIIGYVMLLIPFLGLPIFNKFESEIKIIRISVTFIITILSFKNGAKIKINKPIIMLLIYNIYNVFVLVINSRISTGVLYSLYFLMIIIVYLQQKLYKNDYRLMEALRILYSLVMIINIPSLILQRNIDDYNRIFFIGGKNSVIMFAIPTIFYNYACSYLKYKKINLISKVNIMIAIISSILCGSTTGFIVSSVVTMAIFLQSKIKINFKMLYFLYFVALFLTLNLSTFNNIPMIKDIVENKFNKDLTLTGRTYIWDKSLQYIARNPLGYGRGNLILASTFNGINECHNLFLQILFDGGIPSLVIFLMYIRYCNQKKYKKDENISSLELVNSAKIAFFAFLFVGLTESVSYNMNLWIILLILYNMINKRNI